MSKKAVAAKQGSGLDLKSLYNQIMQLSEKRIIIKGILVALNTGTKIFSYEDFKSTNNYSIFAACEAKEAIAQLKMIPTINPVEKSQKGLKGTGKKETFTSAKIAQLIKSIQLKANKYDAKLEKFNTENMIDIPESLTDMFKEDIAV